LPTAIVVDGLDFLAAFYPVHIRKEDKAFFLPAMDYLSAGEKAAMLDAEHAFDRKFIHVLYREKVESIGAGPRR
jgi:hypothetical protein